MPLILLALTLAAPARADEPDCTLRSYPADGATDVHPEVQSLFFEGGGHADRRYDVIARVDGSVVVDGPGSVMRNALPEPPGPGRTVELDVTWQHDPEDWEGSGPECTATVRFTTATGPIHQGDFEDLRVDVFEVSGGTHPTYSIQGSLPGTGHQVLVASPEANFVDATWVVPTEQEPDFTLSDTAFDPGKWGYRQCVDLWGYIPGEPTEPIDEVCRGTCSSVPRSSVVWALVLAAAGLVWGRRRR